MSDVTLRLFVAALKAPHPGDPFLERVEPVRGLAGVSIAGGALARLTASISEEGVVLWVCARRGLGMGALDERVEVSLM
ncbi:MAG TPA: hypothetical protein VN829_14480 [Dongiaceae bacterium]|nr:hypothetical protein [Dongiaceae bacterium]